MRGAGSTIASVMPVSTVIIGGIGTPGFTNVSNRPEQLAAAHAQRADLGDRVGGRRTAGRLEVDDDERHVGERRAEIVERLLPGGIAGAAGAVSKPDSTGANGEVGATEPEDSERLFVAKVCSPGERALAASRLLRPCGGQVTIPRVSTPHSRYRCGACGNLTRFDVVGTRRTRAFHHYSIGGELTVEEEDVLDERIEQVTCRWCGASGDSIELVPVEESA